ncbi:MAG: flagellar basal body rod protein FlgB [Planctomycetota bacterium]
MFSSLFDSTAIPTLQHVVGFTQARHGVLAGNVANLDTPGYRTRDLSPEEFQESLKEALELRRAAPSPTARLNAELAGLRPAQAGAEFDKVRDSMKDILYHDDSYVSLEKQVAAIAKNQAQHNLALSIMTSQFRLLRAAISERV